MVLRTATFVALLALPLATGACKGGGGSASSERTPPPPVERKDGKLFVPESSPLRKT